MTRRSNRLQRSRGRPQTLMGRLRAALGHDTYSFYLLPRDIAAVRQSAAAAHLPARTHFLDSIAVAELKRVLPTDLLTGNRTQVVFDAIEMQQIPVAKFKRWSLATGRDIQDCVSSLVFQLFGEPPQKPDGVPEMVWSAWAAAPWKSNQPELSWSDFYKLFIKGADQ